MAMICRVVTEGVTDEMVLRALLAPHVPQQLFSITAAGGLSPAISLARTLLLKGRYYVALTVDSDSVEEIEIQRRTRIAEQLLGPFEADRYRVFIAIPSVESWLFLDPKVTASIVGKSAPSTVIKHVQTHPKQMLKWVLRHRYQRDKLPALQQLLNEIDLRPLGRRHPLSDLIAYILSTATASSMTGPSVK
jgi:hypothetical protein